MPAYRSEPYSHSYGSQVFGPPARISRERSTSQRKRDSSLPRIDAIEDEGDDSTDDSPSGAEDRLGSSDCESENEAGVGPSLQWPLSPQTDYSDAWPPRYSTPAFGKQQSLPALPFQRPISIAGGQSFDPTSMNPDVSKRFSASDIEVKYKPPDQGPTTQLPLPKPQNSPLKLYPWMTRKESPPPPKTVIHCPYPTNGCAVSLPKDMALWRRHLTKKHGLVQDSTPQTCQWPDCGLTMGGRSLNRHVLMTHMDFRKRCPYCEARLRDDHMKKHIKNCSDNPAKEAEETKEAKDAKKAKGA